MHILKRPTFLTIWLVVAVVVNILGVLLYSGGIKGRGILAVELLDLIQIIQLVGFFMVWMWKKMGLYLAAVMVVAAVIANAYVFTQQQAVNIAILGIIGVGVLYLAMRPVWKNFK